MINLYWPTYLSIEREFNQLLSFIHVDDEQLNVYSSKISELILRSVSEIESISKELYYQYGGTKKGNIHFDYEALSYLDDLWNLSSKIILITSLHSFQSVKVITPFNKDFNRAKGNTYSWNNAYQALKHYRAENLKLGTIDNLFKAASALYLLNIYFKDQVFPLGSDCSGLNFPINLGSDIFSIKVHNGGNGEDFQKRKDFDECVYTTKATGETLMELKDQAKKLGSG